MQKKLQNDLRGLAHSILQMKDEGEIAILHQKAVALSEKLSLLKFVNEYINENDEITVSTDFNESTSEKVESNKNEEQPPVFEEIISEDHTDETVHNFEETSEERPLQQVIKESINQEPKPKVKEQKVVVDTVDNKKLIKISLNDRVLIVNDLFEGNQSDFNRVLSQLNSFETYKEAVYFIKKMVKPDYQWENFTSTEMCLMNYISEKFSD